MNTFIYIERTPIDIASREPIEKDKLHNLIKENLDGLISIRNQNSEAFERYAERANLTNRYLCMGSETEHDKQGIRYFDRIPLQSAQAEQWERARIWTAQILDEWIVTQISALTTLEDNREEDMQFSFLEEVDTNIVGSWRSAIMSKTIIGMTCEDCGYVIPASTVKSHRASLKCMQAANDRDLRQAGWQQVSLGQHINAIKKAGIEFEVRATGFAMWIPPWVQSAIATYEEKNGYAGLKLEEFLAKLKVEQNG